MKFDESVPGIANRPLKDWIRLCSAMSVTDYDESIDDAEVHIGLSGIQIYLKDFAIILVPNIYDSRQKKDNEVWGLTPEIVEEMEYHPKETPTLPIVKDVREDIPIAGTLHDHVSSNQILAEQAMEYLMMEINGLCEGDDTADIVKSIMEKYCLHYVFRDKEGTIWEIPLQKMNTVFMEQPKLEDAELIGTTFKNPYET